MKTSKIFWGILIIGCGVMLLLSALGLGDQYEAVRIIGSALLGGIAIASLVKLNFFLTTIPLALIIYLWRVQLGLPTVDVWLLLAAAAVLGIGLSIIFHKKTRFVKKFGEHSSTVAETEDIVGDAEVVNINATFTEQTKYLHANGLKRVNLSSSFASVKVYFDQCQPGNAGLTVQANVSFSGVVLHVPQGWHVENQVNTFAGEVNDRSGAGAPDGCKLLLTGNLNFGEIKIVRI